jgi:IS30 family transposase
MYEYVDFNDKNLWNGIGERYSADVAQSKRNYAGSAKGGGLKIDNFPEESKELERLRKSGFSPYAALQKLGLDICVKTVYNYIDKNIFLTISNKDLLVKKNKKKRNYRKIKRKAHNNGRGTSISERPEKINNREEFGHWEIDLVVGKQGTKPVLLTLDERKTRHRLAVRLPNKSQKSVLKALKRLGKHYRFRSITADNGSEFLDYKSIEKWLKTKVYYAHPFSSWERGTNENQNRFVRRFFPKGTDFSRISLGKLQQTIDFINNYPRSILGGKSSAQLFYELTA